MPDYSEFPTTPTGWQERAWQEIAPLETEAPPPPRRRAVDLIALIPGVFFVVLAVAVMAGVSIRFLFGGGVLWLVLIGAGAALLVSELRKARARR